jgi:hypothetical protein
VASAAVMAGVVLLVQHSVAASLGHWERVLLAAVAGVLSYLPVVLFLDPTLRREAKAARHELFPAYSGRIVEP